ncbi:MAG: MFS transporter [Clostridiales bacterium]|nr:MFS transporter [Clostridiales bacterium]
MTTPSTPKINVKNTILVGLAFMTISAFWQLYEFKIPLILKNTFEISDTWAGFIMSLDNIIALFMLPLFGVLSDRTHTKIGRRKPYIIFGTLASVILMMLIPYAAQTTQVTFFIVALGFLLISMATYRSPAVALMPDITPKPLRSKGNAIINLMGAVGGAIILLLISLLSSKNTDPLTTNHWPIFIAAAIIMVVGVLILIFTVNEPKLVKKMHKDSAAMGLDIEDVDDISKPVKAKNIAKEKLPNDVRKSMRLLLISIALWFIGYNAVTTAFSKYSVVRLGMTESQASLILMVAIVTATIAFIPVGIISSKVGRRKSILFGIVLLTTVFATASLYTSYSPLMFVSFSLAGIGWATINVNSLPMVLEMSKNASVGEYTGYYYTFSMAAQVITPIASGALLQYVGYYTLLPYGAFFIGLAFFTMLMVKHGDSKPLVPKSKLELLDIDD